MSRMGFVLAGGKSSRMGVNKAFLPTERGPLVSQIAEMVRVAAGSTVLVGNPQTYGGLGYRVIPDNFPDAGPLGGIQAALASAFAADWNLIVACVMPQLDPVLMAGLFTEAERAADCDCLIPIGQDGRPQPLCAIYHRGGVTAIQSALARGQRRVTDALSGLRVQRAYLGRTESFRNVNTPEEWQSWMAGSFAVR